MYNHNLLFTSCTSTSNSVSLGDGGGIYLRQYNHAISFLQCIINWNIVTAGGDGGGIK